MIILKSIEQELSSIQWNRITKVEHKRSFYAYEPFFREAYADISQVVGHRAHEVLHRYATLCFLPDAIAGRKIEAGLEFLERAGFEVVSLYQVQYDFRSYNADWRFQLNDTTIERTELSHALVEMSPSLLAILRDRCSESSVPASVKLKRLKGASNPTKRASLNMRDSLGSVNRMIKFIHSADEPIDLIRMLGILFSRTQRLSLLEDLKEGIICSNVDIQATIRDLYGRCPVHDLDFEKSYWRFVEKISPSDETSEKHAARQLIRQMTDAKHGAAVDWLTVMDCMHSLRLDVRDWDFIVALSHLIKHKFDGVGSTISSDGDQDWPRVTG